ncbi:SH3 domain-containing protein [Pararhodospirillum oryzae]|nr:SH3 domain-containing protein [Pararhodospirillum oryzae]
MARRGGVGLVIAALVCTVPGAGTVHASAQQAAPQQEIAPSGLPLPRFVSLRSNEVNMRSGPGTRYPVIWIYRQRSLPVEIIAEYDNWRKVRDHEGAEGWIQQSMVVGYRTFITLGAVQVLRADPGPQGRPVARIGPNVVGRLHNCPAGSAYCRVEVADRQGWLPRAGLWGVYRDEVVD